MEKYNLSLMELYIKAGNPYDHFLQKIPVNI